MWESFSISFLYYHLWEFFFLSLYENKQPYEYRRLKQIFYRQNSIMIFNYFICTKLVFFTLSYFHFVCDYFFLKYSFFKCIKLSRNIYSFCCIRFFTIIWKKLNTFLILIQQIYWSAFLCVQLWFCQRSFHFDYHRTLILLKSC